MLLDPRPTLLSSFCLIRCRFTRSRVVWLFVDRASVLRLPVYAG